MPTDGSQSVVRCISRYLVISYRTPKAGDFRRSIFRSRNVTADVPRGPTTWVIIGRYEESSHRIPVDPCLPPKSWYITGIHRALNLLDVSERARTYVFHTFVCHGNLGRNSGIKDLHPYSYYTPSEIESTMKKYSVWFKRGQEEGWPQRQKR